MKEKFYEKLVDFFEEMLTATIDELELFTYYLDLLKLVSDNPDKTIETLCTDIRMYLGHEKFDINYLYAKIMGEIMDIISDHIKHPEELESMQIFIDFIDTKFELEPLNNWHKYKTKQGLFKAIDLYLEEVNNPT